MSWFAAIIAGFCLPLPSFSQSAGANPFLIDGIRSGNSTFAWIRHVGNQTFITNDASDDDLGTTVWNLPDGADEATLVSDLPGAKVIVRAGGRTLVATVDLELWELNQGTNGLEGTQLDKFDKEVTRMAEVAGRALIGTVKHGLWALANGSSVAVQIGGLPNSAQINQIVRTGDRALIGTQGYGLWTLAEGASGAVRIAGPRSAASITEIALVSDRVLVVANFDTFDSLWSVDLASNRAQLITDDLVDADIQVIQEVGNRTLIGTNEGVLALKKGSNALSNIAITPNHPPERNRNAGQVFVSTIVALGDDALIGTSGDGLWRLAKDAETGLLVAGIGERDTVDLMVQVGNRALVNTFVAGAPEAENKLSVVDAGTSEARTITAIQLTGYLKSMATSGDRVLFCTDRALYQFRFTAGRQPWPVTAKVQWSLPNVIEPATVSVTVPVEDRPGWISAATAISEVTVYRKDQVTVVNHKTIRGPAEANFTLPAGEYCMTATVTSALGEKSQTIRNTELITVRPKPTDLAGIAQKIAGGGTTIWLVATLALIVASRWSDSAFRLVTGPTIPKIVQWYAPLFEHARPIRLWLLDRTYQRMRSEWSRPRSFVEPTITLADGQKVPALEALLRQFKAPPTERRTTAPARVWITGRAGTGKSTLLEALLGRITSPPTLASSWREHGVLPLMIRVRDFGTGEVIDAIARHLEPYGIDDAKLVARLLRTGDFLVILDGANERNWDDAIKAFLVRFPEVPVIISSQTNSRLAGIEGWTLPLLDAAFAREVLRVHLPAGAAATAVPDELWSELKSGYDVVLLAELIAARCPIPDSKLGLYEATLNRAGTLWKGDGAFVDLRASLCHRAWDLWLEDGYDILPSASLPDMFVQHLCDTVHVLVRIGERYQFRHELMRQYLAASWAVSESASVKDLVHRLENEAIWQLGRTQQREVFAFITELLETVADLQEVANVAGKNIAQRAVLAEAVQETAKRRGWKISMALNLG